MPSLFQTPPLKLLERADGQMRIWLPQPTLLVSRGRGYLHHEFAVEIIRSLDAISPSRPVMQFHDWLDIQGFDIRCQRDLTAWHVTNRQRVKRLDIAAHSALVRMGVAVANVALKGVIRLYDNVVSFESQVEQALTSPP